MADACECGNEPSGSVKWGNFLTGCKPVNFSRRTLHHGVRVKLLFSLSNTNTETDYNLIITTYIIYKDWDMSVSIFPLSLSLIILLINSEISIQ